MNELFTNLVWQWTFLDISKMFWLGTAGLKLRVGPSDVHFSARGLKTCPWHGGQCILAIYSCPKGVPLPPPRVKAALTGIPWERIPWEGIPWSVPPGVKRACVCTEPSLRWAQTTGLGDKRNFLLLIWRSLILCLPLPKFPKCFAQGQTKHCIWARLIVHIFQSSKEEKIKHFLGHSEVTLLQNWFSP